MAMRSTGMGGNAGAVAAGAFVAAVLAVGLFSFWPRPDPVAPDAPLKLAQPVPSGAPDTDTVIAEPVADPETARAPEAAEPAPADGTAPEAVRSSASPDADQPDHSAAMTPETPRFDELRREPDGMSVVAGSGAPGATVNLLQDGTKIGETVIDGSGKFAMIVQIEPDDQGHVLTMSQHVYGTETLSRDEILLAPVTPQAPQLAAMDATGVAPTALVTPGAASDTDLSPPDDLNIAGTAGVKPAGPADAPKPTPDATVEPLATPAAGTGGQDAAAEVEIAALQETPAAPALPTPEGSGQVAILKSTEDGVELMNPPRPTAMDTVALDTISYSDTGDVRLAGRAQDGAREVRVYLDNVVIAELPVDETGRWRGELPDVDEGIYTLRVDEVSATGDVTSRVETPFKRENPQVLADAAAGQSGPLRAITVQKGATLWAIARDRYGDGLLYVRVFEANAGAIRDPDLIYPGQVFDLPD